VYLCLNHGRSTKSRLEVRAASPDVLNILRTLIRFLCDGSILEKAVGSSRRHRDNNFLLPSSIVDLAVF
jgi:hypothetical protein